MAQAQSQQIAQIIREHTGNNVELIPITTQGDISTAPLTQIGGTGVFVSAVRDALLSDEVDIAVHSLKDLPTSDTAGITLAAVPQRDDPRDALIGAAPLQELPAGAVIGTGSPRRAEQIRTLRPDLVPRPIRGNAETRINKTRTGECDAVVLALAGLRRIGRTEDIVQVFEAEEMLPAVGQGALAVECRTDNAQLCEALAAVEDAATRAAVEAERAVLRTLESGCAAPVGAYATVHSDTLSLQAVLLTDDKRFFSAREGRVADAVQLGVSAAHELLQQQAT